MLCDKESARALGGHRVYKDRTSARSKRKSQFSATASLKGGSNATESLATDCNFRSADHGLRGRPHHRAQLQSRPNRTGSATGLGSNPSAPSCTSTCNSLKRRTGHRIGTDDGGGI